MSGVMLIRFQSLNRLFRFTIQIEDLSIFIAYLKAALNTADMKTPDNPGTSLNISMTI